MSNSRYCFGPDLVKFLFLIEFNKLFIFYENVPMHVMFISAAGKETYGRKGYKIRFWATNIKVILFLRNVFF